MDQELTILNRCRPELIRERATILFAVRSSGDEYANRARLNPGGEEFFEDEWHHPENRCRPAQVVDNDQWPPPASRQLS
jgi:hypothetical protein